MTDRRSKYKICSITITSKLSLHSDHYYALGLFQLCDIYHKHDIEVLYVSVTKIIV
jgi:hypothetical protein